MAVRFCCDEEVNQLEGCSIAFIDTSAECNDAIRALNIAGFPEAMISILKGQHSIHMLKLFLSNAIEGMATDDLMKRGVNEMTRGHYAIVVETRDYNEAKVAANITAKHGGHGVTCFRLLDDDAMSACSTESRPAHVRNEF